MGHHVEKRVTTDLRTGDVLEVTEDDNFVINQKDVERYRLTNDWAIPPTKERPIPMKLVHRKESNETLFVGRCIVTILSLGADRGGSRIVATVVCENDSRRLDAIVAGSGCKLKQVPKVIGQAKHCWMFEDKFFAQ